ncbi:major facilitator superfamily domain-containing protein, partial [Chytridium lagenaria]
MSSHAGSSWHAPLTPTSSSQFSTSDTEIGLDDTHEPKPMSRVERLAFLRQTALLLLTTVPEIMIHHMLTPFYPYIVRALLPDVEKQGYYVGLLTSSFFLPTIIGAPLMGHLSDAYGRKPVLIVGLIGYSFGTITLGLSTIYTTALISLFITGCFAGNTVVAKSMIGELGRDDKTRAMGYSAYGVVFGAAGILGTFLGGFLADSSLVGSSEFLKRRPSFLACFVGAGLAGIAIVVTMRTLREVREEEDDGLLEVTFEMEGKKTGELGFGLKHSLSDGDVLKPYPPPKTSGCWIKSLYTLRVILHPYVSIVSATTVPPILLYSLYSLCNSLFHTAMSLLVAAKTERGGYNLTSRDMAVAAMTSSIAKLVVKGAYVPIHARLGTLATYRIGVLVMIPPLLWAPLRLGFDPSASVPPYPLSSSVSPLPSVPSLPPLNPTLLHNATTFTNLTTSLTTPTSPSLPLPPSLKASALPLIIGSLFLGIGEGLSYLTIVMFLTDSVPASSLGALHGLAACMASIMKTLGPIVGGVVWEIAPTW